MVVFIGVTDWVELQAMSVELTSVSNESVDLTSSRTGGGSGFKVARLLGEAAFKRVRREVTLWNSGRWVHDPRAYVWWRVHEGMEGIWGRGKGGEIGVEGGARRSMGALLARILTRKGRPLHKTRCRAAGLSCWPWL